MGVEALYIFNEHNNQILSHVYTARPPAPSVLLPLYLSSSSPPRPSLVHLPNTHPPTLLHSLIVDNLLFLCPSSTDTEPLLILEFLHRVADALQEFLGSPLLPTKIEAQCDVVAQILGEMCDAGVVNTTEPNTLREVVETESWVGNFLGGFGLPSSSPGLGNTQFQRPTSPFSSMTSSGNGTPTSASGSAIPWRRPNVRHTSNELYVDIVESLSVIVAPSGRPLSAFANGTIAFRSQMSGVPDLLLKLTAPGGPAGIRQAMDLPCFHPCVRLAHWRERPGELSFVPPDGKFVLAGYECNLLPDLFAGDSASAKIQTPKLNLPVTIELRPSLGSLGDELEVRLVAQASAAPPPSTSAVPSMANRTASYSGRVGAGSATSGANGGPTSTGALIDDIRVNLPVAESVRNVNDIRCTVGEAHFQPLERTIEWRISKKEAAAMAGSAATLRCSLAGPLEDHAQATLGQANELTVRTDDYEYDENAEESYQSTNGARHPKKPTQAVTQAEPVASQQVQQNAMLMPRTACLSFTAKGWLASGIKVESLTINTQTSKGLGAGVTPYKGVKYHTVSRNGIEVRC